MTYYNIEQNSDEWFLSRAGKITSSNFGCIMANYSKSFGEPAKRYAKKVAVERLLNAPLPSDYTNDHMQRGIEQEPIARELYERTFFCSVANGGFFDLEQFGTSPDGLVDHNGQIEIKSVIANIHVDNIRRKSIDPAYKWQCVGSLMITGREWLDFVSYCADFPEGKNLFVYRIHAVAFRDEFSQLLGRLTEFNQLVEEIKTDLVNAEYIIQ